MSAAGFELSKRLGLRESLEQYAARHGVSPAEARPDWRSDGALALGALVVSPDVAALGICRVHRGFSCPTRNPFETGWP